MNTQDFITRSNIKHDNKYTYNNSIVNNYKDKININCPIHGSFHQQASHHLRGNGCPKCARELNGSLQRTSLEDILTKFNSTHNYKYDYSKVLFTSLNKKVEIVCSTHGSFFQKPSDHINGTGCPKCSIQTMTTTLGNFISQAVLIHGTKYDYSQVNYINNHTKIDIMCPIHGIFKPTPQNHLTRKSGCPMCSNKSKGKFNKLTKDQVLTIANDIHNNKYTYNLIDYENTSSKILITCPSHGEFLQKTTNHIFMKQGCPSCGYIGRYSTEWFDNEDNRTIPGILYVLKFNQNEENFYKIGITQKTLKERWKSPKGYIIEEEYILHTTLYNAFLIEQYLLKTHLYKMRHIPSAKIGGDAECFKFTNQQSLNWLIQEIENHHNVLT